MIYRKAEPQTLYFTYDDPTIRFDAFNDVVEINVREQSDHIHSIFVSRNDTAKIVGVWLNSIKRGEFSQVFRAVNSLRVRDELDKEGIRVDPTETPLDFGGDQFVSVDEHGVQLEIISTEPDTDNDEHVVRYEFSNSDMVRLFIWSTFAEDNAK